VSVVQINLWTCDLCGKRSAQSERTSAYSDPVIVPPAGWRTDLEVPQEKRSDPSFDICDACPECVAEPDWSNYSELIGALVVGCPKESQ